MKEGIKELIKTATPCKGTVKYYEEIDGKKVKKTRTCGHLPEINKVNDMFYAQCKHCSRWDPYQFLGTTPKNAIAQWNAYNGKHAPDGIFLD